jgi:GAF domain-containing protein
MNEQSTNIWTRIKSWWERVVTVDVSDPDQAREGRLFNTLLIISIGITVSLVLTFILTWLLGLTERSVALIAAAFPLGFIPLSLFCIDQAKRGRIRSMLHIFVWVNFAGIAIAAFTFDGIRSPAWVLYAWTITIAGVLLAPRYSLIMTGLVLGYFGVLFGLGRLGLYTPLLTLEPAGREFTQIAFTLMMLVTTVGLLTYLNMHNLGEAMERLEDTKGRLEKHRRSLEQQVAARTADLEQRSTQLETAAQVAREAAAIHDLDELLGRAVTLISERFDFYHAGLFLLDDLQDYAILRSASSEGGRRMLERGHRLAVGREGIVGHVAQTGEPRIALDVGDDAVFFDNPDLPLTRSEMALPLEVRGEVMGVLDVQSTEAQAFDDDDISILQTMADQVALAIDNTRLLEEAQARVQEVRALLRQESLEGWERVVAERPGWGYIYDGGHVTSRELEGTTDEDWQSRVPLQVRGEAIGRLNLDLGERPITSEEQALIKSVADQASQALESARLFQETQRALGETEALYRASRAIVAAQSRAEILQAFTDHVIPPQIDRCMLAFVGPKTSVGDQVVEVVAAWEPGIEQPDVLGTRWSMAQAPIMADLTADPLVIADVMTSSALDDVSQYFFERVLGVDAVAIIPLVAGERFLGWLLVESLEGAYEFSERQIRLYRTLADQIAVALEGLRLLEETERRARRERLAAEITSRVRASSDIDAILRTAVRELGQSLRASEAWIRLEDSDEETSPLDEQVVG